jgi:hypothetical protein
MSAIRCIRDHPDFENSSQLKAQANRSKPRHDGKKTRRDLDEEDVESIVATLHDSIRLPTAAAAVMLLPVSNVDSWSEM